MAEQKTKPTDADVEAFLNAIPDEGKRRDAFAILELMRDVTQMEPKLWGGSMIGFGKYHYKYASGHEGDSFLTGFAPRKANLTVYLNPGFDQSDELFSSLGKHKLGKGCLYIKKLEDVDQATLRELVAQSVEHIKKLYP